MSDADGSLQLRRSTAPSGEAVTFGHTLLERPNTDEIAWQDTVEVRGRSLASLVSAGELPARVGILKIDTEGHDFAVVQGMGDLEADVVVVEHWQDLPNSLGPCPWTGEDMVSALEWRGFSNYAFIAHRGEFLALQWNDASVEPGHMGNIVFMHDRVVDDVLPDLLECASQVASSAVAVGEMYATAAKVRLELVERLEHECQERLELIERLEHECEERLRAYDELAASVLKTANGEPTA